MAMRLVWPDEETMPKKRKSTPISKEIPPEDVGTDAADANGDAARDTLEAEDGPVEAAAVEETPADPEEADEPEESKPIDLKVLEALLFSTHHPLTGQRFAELLDVRSQKTIRAAVQELNKQYEETGRTFRVEQVAGGYQLLSLPEYGDILKRLLAKESDARLTKAALETLAIIAYKQPILRADVEAIRGVACGETIRSLMEKHLVNIAGRAEEPGRPILYGTTKRFLQLFGLNNLKDLPQSEELPKPRE
jgi:segregation and condensation protein B